MPAKKKIPFAVSRRGAGSLTDQTAEGFRLAISGGYYAEGDVLPPLVRISQELGVSMIVSRLAVKRLVDEGLIVPRPGVGCEVVGKYAAQWRGRALFVVPERNDIYHVNVVGDVLRRRLAAAGCRFEQLTVAKRADGSYDLSQLRPRLLDRGLLVVQMFAVPEIAREVAAAGVRSIVVARDGAGAFRGSEVVRFSGGAAVPELVSRCVATGVRTALQFGFEYGVADASAALEKAGVKTENVCVRVDSRDDGVIAAVKRATIEYFGRRLASSRPLPDLVYFTDDFAAEAGLMAMALAGVRAPDDVFVASWANRGLAPVYDRTVARMEVDPFANGEALADFVVSALDGGAHIPPPVFAPEFIDGETFPRAHDGRRAKKERKNSKWKS